MNSWIVIVGLFIGLSAQADFTVSDPNGVLKDLQNFQPGVSFDQAFQCGQKAVTQASVTSCQVTCNDSFCESKCDDIHQGNPVKFNLTVDECSADKVFVFGDNGLNIEIDKTDYVASSNYWIIPFLKNLGSFIQPDGVVTFTSQMPRMIDYIADGKKQTLMANMLMGEIKFAGAQMGMSFELWVTPQLDGLRQILLFKMDTDIFYQTRGLIYQDQP